MSTHENPPKKIVQTVETTTVRYTTPWCIWPTLQELADIVQAAESLPVNTPVQISKSNLGEGSKRLWTFTIEIKETK